MYAVITFFFSAKIRKNCRILIKDHMFLHGHNTEKPENQSIVIQQNMSDCRANSRSPTT